MRGYKSRIQSTTGLPAIATAPFWARYQSAPRGDDPALEKRLTALAEQYPRYEYSLPHDILKNEGWVTNRKRTYRIYQKLDLQVRTQRRKKLNRPGSLC